MKRIFATLFCLVLAMTGSAQPVNYPYEVKAISLQIEGQQVRMAYMDVSPARPNGKVVLLLHGKNFNGYYWKDVVRFLTANGYRVVAPDQVGWGRSDKPNIHYSFHLLAANTKQLLDALGIQRSIVVGHSIGGMLATRFALMYPDVTEKLVLEDPIGIEDYKTFVPYTSLDSENHKELMADYAAMKKYQQGYYPEWKPEYEQYVQAQYDAMQYPDFKQATWASAITYEMIYEQPVVYEFKNITAKTLVMVGTADHTIVGKDLLSKDEAAKHGRYPELGEWLHGQIKGSELVEIPGSGHIPHVQMPDIFREKLLSFLAEG